MRLQPTVIVYHGVGDCPPSADPYHLIRPTAEFAWQMGYLARHRRVIPLAAVVDGTAGTRVPTRSDESRPAVAITFDDGYRSLLTHALPILERHGFPATAFVPTRWIGDHNGWDPSPPGACLLEIMNADEIRTCAERGIEIGSHGHAHVHTARAAVEEAAADLQTSRRILGEVLGRPPRFLAYPWGEHSALVRAAAAQAGFEAAFSINQPSRGPFALARVAIRRSDGESLFRLKTSGVYPQLRMSLLPRAGLRLVDPALRRYRESR